MEEPRIRARAKTLSNGDLKISLIIPSSLLRVADMTFVLARCRYLLTDEIDRHLTNRRLVAKLQPGAPSAGMGLLKARGDDPRRHEREAGQ